MYILYCMYFQHFCYIW